MLTELTTEEFAAALDAVAASVLDEEGMSELPIDAVAVAKSLGLKVIFQPHQESRAQIVRLAAHTSIALRPDPRDERQQWAVAHEIGEHLAIQVFAQLEIDPRVVGRTAREKIANQLAGRILLPSEMFVAAARQTHWDVLLLKQRFSTASHELIARRMLDFPQPVLITIFDQGKQSFRGSNLGGRTPALNRWEQQAWTAAHETGQAQNAGNTVWQVQAWPIHEKSWRREILRTSWGVEAEEDHSC